MKKVMVIFLLGYLFSFLSAQQNPIGSVKIHTEDIDLFWDCYDAAKPNFTADYFERYLTEGSAGVKGFINYRIESAKKLAKTISSNQEYYEMIRPYSLKIKSTFASDIQTIFDSMREWYPATVYPETYFVIGRLNTGGTAFKNGIIMGAEMFGPQNQEELNAIIDYKVIPGIVAHEMIHFQQNLPWAKSLLAQTVREGSADFLATLIQGNPLNHHLDHWAIPKAEMLWGQFQEQMNGKNYKGWLYGGKRPKGWPADLGYWMGFQITKAFYLRQPDKKQAVRDILNIKDFEAFLKASEFDGSCSKDYSGTWDYVAQIDGDGEYFGSLVLQQTSLEYSGFIRSDRGQWPIRIINVQENTLVFTSEAEEVNSIISISFNENKFEGEVQIEGDDTNHRITAKRKQ